jgi:hypothetical protein
MFSFYHVDVPSSGVQGWHSFLNSFHHAVKSCFMKYIL